MATITPGRVTRLHFDHPEQIVKERRWGGIRMAPDIAPIAASTGGRDAPSNLFMRYWSKARVWTARPLQEDMSKIQEAASALPQDDIFANPPDGLSASAVEFATYAAEHAIWNQATGFGLVYEPSLVARGDRFWQKLVASGASNTGGQTWEQRIAATSGFPQGECLSDSHAPMDALYTNDTGENRGWNLRWYVPGTSLSHPDFILNYHFGQYCLAISGTGLAYLCEYCRQTVSGAYRWVLRKTFPYCLPSQVCQVAHSLTIFPLRGADGEKFIIFTSTNAASGGVTVLTHGSVSGTNAPNEEIYEANQLTRFGDVDEYPDGVTARGHRIDVRRDLRVAFSITRLCFLAGGYIADSPWRLPWFSSDQPVDCRFFLTVPSGESGTSGPYKATVQAFDQLTGSPLTSATDLYVADYKYLNIPSFTPDQLLSVHISFGTEDGDLVMFDTPILYGYQLNREPVVATINVGEGFTTPIRSIDLKAATNPNPQQDSGSAVVMDVGDQYPRLRNRGELNCKATIFAEGLGVDGDEDAKVTLFRGDAVRPRRKKLGIDGMGQGGFGTGPERVYPSPDWSQYDIFLTGMYRRGSEFQKGLISVQEFARDDSAPIDPETGFSPPWKVTDAIRYMLSLTGLPASMIEIDDDPMRMYAGFAPVEYLLYEPYTNILDRCIALAWGYLGARLVFDPNAGPIAGASRTDEGYPEGAWKILYQTPEGSTPIFHFVTKPDDPAAIPTHPGAYPIDTTWCEGPLESYVIPPDFNHSYTCTAPPMADAPAGFKVSRHRYNMQSYAVPGSSVTPDPDSPHYIGRERFLYDIDPALVVGGPDAYRRTQLAVDFVANRRMNYAGRARRVQIVRGPLALVKDAVTDRWRILRYGDPVTFKAETGWYIRSCSPLYDLDSAQMADYELEMVVPL